ncbi:MAG: AMP-binding protein [Planctomycetes bacterium]|nr:AMP-binding protein [Planctomycetota bacterium]
MDPSSSKLHTADDVASLLGVELDTLYRYARRGELRGLKMGKLWRFTQADVEEFIQSRRFHGGALAGAARLLPEILDRAARANRPGAGIASAEGRYSYGQIDLWSNRLAAALMSKGVARGDRVLVVLPNSVEFVVACFAVWKAGAVLVPESTAIRPANMRHVVEDARPTALILGRSVAEQFEAACWPFQDLKAVFVQNQTFALSGIESTEVESLNAVLEADAPFDSRTWRGGQSDDIVSITYTSGSTGLPKGVIHTHASWLAGAEFSRDYPGVTANDCIVISLPLYHGLAFRQVLAYMMAGGSMIVATDIYQALKWLREQRPTALLLVPAACGIMIDHFAPVLREADDHLRYVEIGSAPMSPERLNALRQLLPTTPVHLPYGLTEARVGFLERGEEGRLNRISGVSPGLELRVVNGDGRPAGKGETGEIVLRGRGLMKGYWGHPADERARLEVDGFHSGDLARVNSRGDVELLGRMDDVLKIGGRKVIPHEVEAALNSHPAVGESAVVGRPDPKGVFELELHAFVVLKGRGEGVTTEELLDHCRKQLEPYKLPAHVHIRKSLPKSAVGKVLKTVLQAEPQAQAG